MHISTRGLRSAGALAGLALLGACTHGTSARPPAPSSSVTQPAAGPTAAASGKSTSTKATPSRSSAAAGAENEKPPAGGACKYAATSSVAAAFGGTVTAATAGTTPIGNPTCQFTLSKTNIGVGGTVTLAITAKSGAAAFAAAKRQAGSAARAVSGVRDQAFFVASTATVRILHGSALVAVTGDLRVPGNPTPKPDVLAADLAALGRTVAAQL